MNRTIYHIKFYRHGKKVLWESTKGMSLKSVVDMADIEIDGFDKYCYEIWDNDDCPDNWLCSFDFRELPFDQQFTWIYGDTAIDDISKLTSGLVSDSPAFRTNSVTRLWYLDQIENYLTGSIS